MRILAAALVMTATPAAADVVMFKTPSGNIVCSIGTGEGPADIDCTLFVHDGTPKSAVLATCGHRAYRVRMGERGPVTAGCSRDTPASGSGVEVAGYGDRGDFGAISCLSASSGFQCRNADGHGFHLSRASQTVH